MHRRLPLGITILALVGAAFVVLPVLGGQPQFGTWQSLVLVDTNRDNPHRKVRLSFVPG